MKRDKNEVIAVGFLSDSGIKACRRCSTYQVTHNQSYSHWGTRDGNIDIFRDRPSESVKKVRKTAPISKLPSTGWEP